MGKLGDDFLILMDQIKRGVDPSAAILLRMRLALNKIESDDVSIMRNQSEIDVLNSLGYSVHVFDNAGDTDISSGATDLTMDTEGQRDEEIFGFTADDAHITVKVKGKYLVVYDVGTYITAGTSRSDSQAWLMRDPLGGGSYAEVNGSRGNMYNRQAGVDKASCSMTKILALTAGDLLKVQAQRTSGTDTVKTDADTCRLTILKLPELL